MAYPSREEKSEVWIERIRSSEDELTWLLIRIVKALVEAAIIFMMVFPTA